MVTVYTHLETHLYLEHFFIKLHHKLIFEGMSFQTRCDELIAQLDFICSQLIHFSDYRKFENETVSMTADMLNGDNLTAGNITSGGTESILMAMKAYRDRAKALWPHISDPEMVS